MKKLRLLKIVALCSFSLYFYSCSPSLYSPRTSNVPLFSEKGEFESGISMGNNYDIDVDVQYAYAFTNNIGGMANIALCDENSSVSGRGSLVELGAGYFTPVKKMDNLIFETYGLLGVGYVENHFLTDQQNSGFVSSNLLKIGVQPSIGYKHKFFAVALTTRLAYVGYINSRGENPEYQGRDLLHVLKKNSSNIFFEPALTVRAGLENIKFQMQFTPSILLTNDVLPYDEPLLSLGMHIYFKTK